MVLRAEGEVSAAPDMATFRIDLNCLKPKVTDAKSCLVEQSQSLLTALKGFGIPDKDLQTLAVNLNKSYTWRNNSQVFEGYRASTTLVVTVCNLDRLDEIYSELLEKRQLELSTLEYAHSRLDSLSNLAYVQALAKADQLAEALIMSLPTKQKTVVAIGNVQLSQHNPMQQNYERDAAMVQTVMPEAAQSISISTGMIKVRSTLEVAYRLD